MRIRRLWISKFRGIKQLDWTLPIDQRLIALVGPGDSGKSTILDAIHYLLSYRWSVPFADTDFHNGDVEQPIVIRALLIDIPAGLKMEASFGLWLSGVDQAGDVHQDPEDGLLPAVLVQLVVDSSLEPQWSVVRLDGSELRLTSAQRRAFSTFKVDDRTDAQLRWSRSSALGRMSHDEGGERAALAAASRAARDALADHENSSLSEIAQKVQDRLNRIGGGSFRDIKPGLDTSRSSMGAALALYEDVVPLTSFGLGSRRLASLAVQQLGAGTRSVAVVDELESGLEPHRAVRLLNYLLADDGYSQVFVTTHSPVIVEQASIANLATVQCQSGIVSVTCLGGADDLLQRLRRARPSSLLARRVVVVEGKTEYGLLLSCLEAWDAERSEHGQSTSAGEGVAIQDGNGGTEVASRAEALAGLGFIAAAFMDNDDRQVDDAVMAAEAAGVKVVRWNYGLNTEMQVCADLTANGLSELLALGVEVRNGEDTVRQDLNCVDSANTIPSLVVQEWLDAGTTLEEARSRIATAALQRKWFKDVEGGRSLGSWIRHHYAAVELESTVARLEEIRAFAFPGSSESGEASPSEAEDG